MSRVAYFFPFSAVIFPFIFAFYVPKDDAKTVFLVLIYLKFVKLSVSFGSDHFFPLHPFSKKKKRTKSNLFSDKTTFFLLILRNIFPNFWNSFLLQFQATFHWSQSTAWHGFAWTCCFARLASCTCARFRLIDIYRCAIRCDSDETRPASVLPLKLFSYGCCRSLWACRWV